MKRSVRVGMIGLCGLAVGLSGCDRGSAGPPATVAPVDETTAIGLVLPVPGPPEANVWEQAARLEAAQEKVVLEVIAEPAARQADAIREALNRGVAALMVVPADPKAIAPALAEARDQGLPIVLLDRSVPVEGKPLPTVVFPPVERAAVQVVDAASEDARAAGFPADGPALIMANSPDAAGDSPRVAALRQAAEAAKIKVLPIVRFAGYINEATAALRAVLKEHPEVAMVLTEEDMAAQAAVSVRFDLPEDRRRFVVAGFVANEQTLDMMKFNICSGLVDRRLQEFSRRALHAALDLARGQSVPDRIEIETPLVRATGTPSPNYRPPVLRKPEDTPPENLIPRPRR